MKLLIASDLHGDAVCTKELLHLFDRLTPRKLVLLGDILYHGPRNDLPPGYAPKEVISLLSPYKDVILAVRGNCDTEVDQMVLPFPCLSDYAVLFTGDHTLYATHGHIYSPDSPPPLSRKDILLGGHTHIPEARAFGDGNLYLNPGSVSLPKGGHPKTALLYEDGVFLLMTLKGETISVVRPEDFM